MSDEIATGMHWVAIGELVISESARLGMSPKPTGKGKGAPKCLGFHCAQGGECPACDGPTGRGKGGGGGGKWKSGEGRNNAG